MTTLTILEQRNRACKHYTYVLQAKFGFQPLTPAFRYQLEQYLTQYQAWKTAVERGGVGWKAPVALRFDEQKGYYEVVPSEGEV